jgi:hypothetical protein
MEGILEKIKNYIRNNNKMTAKEYMKDLNVEKEALSNLMLRKRLLVQQTNQLE